HRSSLHPIGSALTPRAAVRRTQISLIRTTSPVATPGWHYASSLLATVPRLQHGAARPPRPAVATYLLLFLQAMSVAERLRRGDGRAARAGRVGDAARERLFSVPHEPRFRGSPANEGAHEVRR